MKECGKADDGNRMRHTHTHSQICVMIIKSPDRCQPDVSENAMDNKLKFYAISVGWLLGWMAANRHRERERVKSFLFYDFIIIGLSGRERERESVCSSKIALTLESHFLVLCLHAVMI
jgi:hypothetical protein